MIATFGGGCFWCTETIFQRLEGVSSVFPGYMGGHVENPTYKEVCTGETGHAEVIQIEYDPSLISFEKLLLIFFKTHDATSLNRQGEDVGTQYRSVVFYHDDVQLEATQKCIQALEAEKVFDKAIVTEVTPAETFYVAEDYHHNYFNNNPQNPYCSAVIAPKLTKFIKQYGV